ncbi:hypothetical protein IWQ60_003074 [Tieghemiomyces parasiticus]|uniref:Uncharacterized protein n=1 Tax=Tieghemiomyces parasiticus TaxID=78921 RepID=A0A9W8E0I9_9FUNG|nr:hypothetical protein IWQ60_003074 [Tieghemiomyces parasiticus]
MLKSLLTRSTRAAVQATARPMHRVTVAPSIARTFYVRAEPEGPITTDQSFSSLQALGRGLAQVRQEMAHSADHGSLTGELAQLRRARDMLAATLRDLEELTASETKATTTTRHAGAPELEGSFRPVFHSPYGTAYSPLEANVPTAVQRNTSSRSLPTQSIEAALVDASNPAILEATAGRPAAEVYTSARHMLSELAEAAEDTAASVTTNAGYGSYLPHSGSGEVVEEAAGEYIELTRSEPAVEGTYARDAAQLVREAECFEPKIAGSGYSAVESLNDFHHSV